ncbi:dihydrolipoamide acetyltransferase family protein [uncultured Paenalcaligenes sp.]|uniref:dihydrolipoamide acetyltransferase family protein n=1 Tax=uncultured Paenalcaligenes sp. TaxID=1588925 RepID=UPI002634CFE4|nr:dihydrolipoamide acetyltransferase family protein [uncultured Paenalcaligenes sp.]
MSNYSIKIPDIGEGITEVELVEWFVAVGETVQEDQQVASVMTEKVSVEITSPVSGQVISLGGQAGDVLAVGADLIQLELNGASPAVDETPTLESESSALLSESSRTQPEISAQTVAEPTPSLMPVVTTPQQRLLQKVQASPAVRKRAAELSIDLQQLAQQLGKTQLHHADVDQVLQQSAAPRATKSVKSIPIIGLRRQIAKKMQESSQNIPHFSYVEAVDVTALEQWRHQLNAQWGQSRGHLTLLPFLVRALCLAIEKHPAINSRYNAEDNALEQYQDVHVAIATQTEQGLMVPVLESAQQLSLWQMAAQIQTLAEQARQGTGSLSAQSTLTLSSLGPLGGIVATPIINAPEVAIVGVNRQVQQPVVIDGDIQIRTMMNLSSSFDHRFVDGLHAAEFIQEVRRILESPQLYLIQ